MEIERIKEKGWKTERRNSIGGEIQQEEKMWIWRGMKIYEGRLRHDGNKKKKMSEKNKKSENYEL